MGGACGTYGGKRNPYGPLVRKPEGKRPLVRLMHGWEVNVIMDLKEMGWVGVYWINRVECRDRWRALVNTVMNILVT